MLDTSFEEERMGDPGYRGQFETNSRESWGEPADERWEETMEIAGKRGQRERGGDETRSREGNLEAWSTDFLFV